MEKVGILFTCIQTLIAVLAAIIAFLEYRKHVEQNRYAVLSEYNSRYCNDKNIEVVVKYLIWFLEGHGSKNETEPKKPTIYEKEMFMRFFEELQLQIENDRIGEGKVEDFFAYYAVAAAMCHDFVDGTELNDEKSPEVWARYKDFVHSFPELPNMISDDYTKHNPDSNKGGLTLLIK